LFDKKKQGKKSRDTVPLMILMALTSGVNEADNVGVDGTVSLCWTLSCDFHRQLKPVVEILMRLFFYRL
jgi:hypothetical protein